MNQFFQFTIQSDNKERCVKANISKHLKITFDCIFLQIVIFQIEQFEFIKNWNEMKKCQSTWKRFSKRNLDYEQISFAETKKTNGELLTAVLLRKRISFLLQKIGLLINLKTELKWNEKKVKTMEFIIFVWCFRYEPRIAIAFFSSHCITILNTQLCTHNFLMLIYWGVIILE